VLFLLGAPLKSWAQRPTESLKTFTEPNGAFTFRYSSHLILCEQKRQGVTESHYWVPAESCAAYLPVCDDETGQEHTAIACVAYPRDKFTNTGAFEAATFSVEVLNRVATEAGCLAGPADEIFRRENTTAIHGVSFAVFKFGDAGMNQSVGGQVYRTFHGGKCYQLGINVATANAQTFDPPERELTREDWNEVNYRLEQARDSFRFLK